MTTSSALAPASEVIDVALAASRTAHCVVRVEDNSEADLRFAVNTSTTNGVRRGRRITVIAFDEHDGGVAAGSATRSGDVDVADLVREAEASATSGRPSTDAAAFVDGSVDSEFDESPAQTDLSALTGVLAELPGAFERAHLSGIVLSGYAEHSMVTTYLASSSGFRRRHVQPTGSIQMVARSVDGGKSAWVGQGSPNFADVTVRTFEEELRRRLAWAQHAVELPAGRYEVVLPPSAVADLMIYLYSTMNGQDAEDGRTVFSTPGGATRVGDTLASLPFTLRSDPRDATLACAPFVATSASASHVSVFDNGADLAPTTWINQGVLEQLMYHRAGAAHSGVNFAGSQRLDSRVLPCRHMHSSCSSSICGHGTNGVTTRVSGGRVG